MRLDKDKAYAQTFPLQGISLDYFTLEERKRKENLRSNALKLSARGRFFYQGARLEA